MDQSVTVSLATVEKALQKVIGTLRDARSGSDNIEVPADYFWTIPAGSLFQVESQPTELAIGQVSESMESVAQVLEDDYYPIPYDLVWIAEVLQAVGQGSK